MGLQDCRSDYIDMSIYISILILEAELKTTTKRYTILTKIIRTEKYKFWHG